jgi:heme exporter protein B
MSFFRSLWLLVQKDLLVELRTREMLLSMVLFSLLLVVLFSFAFYTDQERARVYAPGILWITVIFAGTLGFNRLFDREIEDGALDALFMSGAGLRVVFVAKALSHLVFTLLMELLTVPLLIVFFDLEVTTPGLLALSLFLGTVGFSFVGTLFAALLVGARMRDVLLPVVIYPLVVPVLIAGVKSTSGILVDAPFKETGSWLQFMLGFDILYVAMSTWMFSKLMRR